MKKLFRNRYFDLDFYFTGIVFGIFVEWDESLVHLFIPFVHLELKMWSFYKRKNRPQTY